MVKNKANDVQNEYRQVAILYGLAFLAVSSIVPAVANCLEYVVYFCFKSGIDKHRCVIYFVLAVLAIIMWFVLFIPIRSALFVGANDKKLTSRRAKAVFWFLFVILILFFITLFFSEIRFSPFD